MGTGNTHPLQTTSLQTAIEAWLSLHAGFSPFPSARACRLAAVLTGCPRKLPGFGRHMPRQAACHPYALAGGEPPSAFSSSLLSFWCPTPCAQPRPLASWASIPRAPGSLPELPALPARRPWGKAANGFCSLPSHDPPEGSGEMPPFLWKPAASWARGPTQLKGKCEMKHQEKKKKEEHLFTVRRCKAKLFWQIQLSHVERPRVSHLWLYSEAWDFTHDLTNYNIHNALGLLRSLLSPCQSSPSALCWVDVAKLLPFFRVFLIMMHFILLILLPGAENPVVWSWCSCWHTDISKAGCGQRGKKIAGSTLAKCPLYWQATATSFPMDVEKITKLLSRSHLPSASSQGLTRLSRG